LSQPSTARRYAFDTVFDADGAIVSEGAAAPMYSADDLARERAAGFEEGRSSETARAEALAAVALASIAESCARLTDRSLEERRALMRDAGGLALAAARKAAGAALVAFGEDRIVAAFDAAFETFIQTPRIVVRVAPGMESVRDRLEGAARDHGFAGALIVRADATHAAGDVSIDWGEGAVSLSAAEAFARIEAIVADALSSQQHSEDIP
jgi:flagellar biosynthesis/type III secretory pathway protein FliH